MNLLDSLNQSLDYVEENLAGEIDIAHAAGITGSTVYNYHRIFQFVAGISLTEYIRHRRLTLAASDLAFGGETVADVALRYGYDSPTAFNRAFRAQHGVAPSRVLQPGTALKAYPRIRFHLQIKGDTEMEYEIKTMPAFKVVGKRWPVSLENGENFKTIPRLWAEAKPADCETVLKLNDGEPKGLLGVCGEMYEGGFLYYIASASTKEAPEGFYSMQVPEATWAVFHSVGSLPDALQGVIRRFYSEWLPASGYEMDRGCPELEVYTEGDTMAEDYECWAWMPIVKK